MLSLPAPQVAHRDVIRFDHNDETVTGTVVEIGTRRYPDNKVRPIEWVIKVQTDSGYVTAVFDRDETVVALSLDDDKNPSRTRNHPHNYKALGITCINQ